MGLIETDCPDCGGHHVVDEDELKAIIASRPTFNCDRCKITKPTREIVTINVYHDGLKPMCALCAWETGLSESTPGHLGTIGDDGTVTA